MSMCECTKAQGWLADWHVLFWLICNNISGLAALMALNILKNVDLADMDHNSADYLHVLIEVWAIVLPFQWHSASCLTLHLVVFMPWL